jgi:hypothetical protein
MSLALDRAADGTQPTPKPAPNDSWRGTRQSYEEFVRGAVAYETMAKKQQHRRGPIQATSSLSWLKDR